MASMDLEATPGPSAADALWRVRDIRWGQVFLRQDYANLILTAFMREVCYSLWRSYDRSTDFGVGLPAFPPIAPGHPTSPQNPLLWGQKWAEGVRDPVA